MLDRSAVDIGDFGKIQLFRFLFGQAESPLVGKTLVQICFLHDDETQKSGNNHTDYFRNEKNGDLYFGESLMQILMRKRREVSELQQLKLLENTKFFEMKIPKNYEDRRFWLSSALHFSLYTQIVVLAPDNGMALRCKKDEKCFEHLSLEEHYTQMSHPTKYVFSDEVSYFYKLPHLEVCIVSGHLSGCFAHEEQIKTLLDDLKDFYRHVIAIKHRPSQVRVFFFLCKSEVIKEGVEERLIVFEKEFSESWELFR